MSLVPRTVRVLHGQPAAGQDADAAVRLGRGEPAGCDVEGVFPGRRHELARRVAHERVRQAVRAALPPEGETVLVGDPVLVDLRVLPRQPAQDLAAPVVDADGRARGVVLGHAGDGHEVEGPRAEAVGGAGERAHRANLNDVAGEVRGEGAARFVCFRGFHRARGEALRQPVAAVGADVVSGDGLGAPAVGIGEVEDPRVKAPDLRAVEGVNLEARGPAAAPLKRDERVACDLGLEPRAALAQDAAVAVEQDLRGHLDGLGVGPLDIDEARFGAAVGERLVLERAFAALVADRAVKRVVDEEELDDSALRLGRDLRRALGVDLHAGRDGLSAGGHGLGPFRDDAVAPGARDLDEALPAGAGGLEQRMVAKARNAHAYFLGRADDEGSRGNLDVLAVDCDIDERVVGRHCADTSENRVVFS